MQERRRADVEIISMLMPAAASVSKVVAATPGFDFMPAPTRLTRAMSASVVTPSAPISLARVPVTSVALSRSLWGTVKEDRKSVVAGRSGSVRVDLGGRRSIKKKKKQH